MTVEGSKEIIDYLNLSLRMKKIGLRMQIYKDCIYNISYRIFQYFTKTIYELYTNLRNDNNFLIRYSRNIWFHIDKCK